MHKRGGSNLHWLAACQQPPIAQCLGNAAKTVSPKKCHQDDTNVKIVALHQLELSRAKLICISCQ